jgi:hypothetical protein
MGVRIARKSIPLAPHPPGRASELGSEGVWLVSFEKSLKRPESRVQDARILTHLDWSIRFSRMRWAAFTAS